jgi:hypothetical protein
MGGPREGARSAGAQVQEIARGVKRLRAETILEGTRLFQQTQDTSLCLGMSSGTEERLYVLCQLLRHIGLAKEKAPARQLVGRDVLET